MEIKTTEPWDSISSAEYRQWANEYSTPYYLYDADNIIDRVKLIRKLFDDQVKVFYAVKANPNLELLRSVRDDVDGLDISSVGELEQACLAEFDAGVMSFAGPAKTTSELETSISNGVGCISIESSRELLDCVAISKRSNNKANILIRINPQFLNRAFGMKMGGKAVQFGIDEENLDEIISLVKDNSECLNFKGIHIYAGSQCFDTTGVVEGVENTLRIAELIESKYGLLCKTINLGGGFGVSHTKPNQELDINQLAFELLPIIKKYRTARNFEPEILFELGRYLTANAGLYVTQVISSKESRGKSFYMVDGGLHHHLAAAGTFGSALRSNFIIQNLTNRMASKIKCSLAGPSCNPTDLLAINVELPKPELADLVGVLKSGSYGLTASPILFLGRRTPAELVRKNGKVKLGRQVRSITDFN